MIESEEIVVFFFKAEDGIRDGHVTGVQTCALPIFLWLASRTGVRNCSFKKKTGAGKAGFGFLEFGEVEGSNMEAARFEAGACARKRCRENDRAAESQSICGMRLGRIDVDPFMACEQRGVKPRAIREECVAAEMRHCRLQMKTAGNGNGDDFIVVRRKNGGKLADAFGVAALGEADKELSADAKNIATFERAGKRNRFELSKLGEGLSE